MIRVKRIIELVGVLKLLPRTGWMLRGVSPCIAENVAEHSFEVALTAYLVSKALLRKGYRVDTKKVIVMALLHDLEEAITGDIVKPVKRFLDQKLGLHVLRDLLEPEELAMLEEYYGRKGVEALVVKLADSLATLNQACRYARQGYRDVKDLIEAVEKQIDEIVRLLDGSREVEDIVKSLRLC